MFDYSLPVARRTRQREAQVYREYHDELKKRNKKNYKVESSTASVPSASLYGKSLKKVSAVHEFVHSSHDSEQGILKEIRLDGRLRKQDYPVDFLSSESSRAKNVQKSEIGVKGNEKENLIEVDTSSDEVVLVDYEEGVDSTHSKCSVLKSVSTCNGDGHISADVDCEIISGNCSILNSVNTGKCDEYISIDVDDEILSGNCSSLNYISPGTRDGNVFVEVDDEVVSGNVDLDGETDESEKIKSSSSESQEDHMSDMDYEVDEPEKSQSSDSSETSLSSHGERSMKKTVKDEAMKRGRREKIGAGLKKKKAYGLDKLVNLDRDKLGGPKNGDIGSKANCVSKRTRSNFSSRLENKQMEQGTFNNPLSVGEDAEVYYSSSDDEVENDTDFNAEEKDDSVRKAYTSQRKPDFCRNKYCKIELETHQVDLKACSEKWESKTNVNTCDVPRKARRDNNVLEENSLYSTELLSKACSFKLKCEPNYANVCDIPEKGKTNSIDEFNLTKTKGANKKFDVYNILVDSIFKNDMPLEEEISSTTQVSNGVGHETGSLPQKFKFGVEESIVPEKSEEELELDKLWAELDFCLRSSETGFVEPDLAKDLEVSPSRSHVNRSTSCVRCFHQLILDEEIGLKCTLCSYVKLKIKYIVPTFGPYPFGKPSRRYYCREEGFTFNNFRYDDFTDDFHVKSDSQDYCDGTVWDLAPGIKKSMYPHQREGFEFLWKNIAGGIDLEKLRNREGSDEGSGGCIISHAPGTGKTRLTIVFLQTYMELYPTCLPVIIAPRSMLLTWEEEFKKWEVGIPFHNLNKTELTGMENLSALNIFAQARQTSENTMAIRMVKLFSWKNEKSILGISYRLFEKLAGERVNSKWEKGRTILLEFPGIVFFDEGHIPRNADSLIWRTLTKLKTEKRIILSGTPFQNNFTEFYNTLRLVRPKFAHGKDDVLEKKSGRGRKKKISGKWDSLTSYIGKDADDILEQAKLKEVRAMIDPFVHIHRGSILQEKLPGLRNSVIILQPAELQSSILQIIQEVKNPMELDYFESLISVHPSLFLKFKRKECPVDTAVLEKLRLNVDSGVKMKFILELIRLSEPLNEKVLIFSQYLEPLSLIKEHLESHLGWSEGKELLCMDGTRDIKKRQSSISIFNDPTSEVRVLLASTRACSEGINLVGASRVVLLDVVWNPSVERQAICRAYRLGQEKIVYTYHLIASRTREEEKYCRQVEKDRISEMVFSSSARISGLQKVSPSVLDDRILEAMVEHDKIKHIFEKIMCVSKDLNLIKNFGLLEKQGDQSSPS